MSMDKKSVLNAITEVCGHPANLKICHASNPQFTSLEQQINLWASDMLYR